MREHHLENYEKNAHKQTTQKVLSVISQPSTVQIPKVLLTF